MLPPNVPKSLSTPFWTSVVALQAILFQDGGLLALGANTAAIVFVIASIHLLYLNTRLLPVELRPPMWRRVALVAAAVFYGFFVTLWLWSLING
jgi:ABC-type Co2+ transport system permease subunit